MNADKDTDKIHFNNNRHNVIDIQTENFNPFNSGSWWFPVETGQVLLFPSSLVHHVETKKGTNTRISLAFNIFIKGTIGSKKKLTELTLT
jgi:hypothetical protein